MSNGEQMAVTVTLAELERQLASPTLNSYRRNRAAIEIMRATADVETARGGVKNDADPEKVRIRRLAKQHFGT